MRSFTVKENDKDQRLDKFIHKVTWGLPSSLMYKSIRTNGILYDNFEAISSINS